MGGKIPGPRGRTGAAGAAGAAGAVGAGFVSNFRLSMHATDPCGDGSGVSLRYIRYKGGQKALIYNNATAAFEYITIAATVSLALLALGTGMYDVLLASDGSLASVAWVNDTTPPAARSVFEGVDIYTNGVPNKFVIVGSIWVDGSNTVTDTFAGGRYLWNMYNRIPRDMAVIDATNNWTYTTATWRSLNNSTANRLKFIQGLIEDYVEARVEANWLNSVGGLGIGGIGLDRTNGNDATILTSPPSGTGSLSQGAGSQASYRGKPGLGLHYLQAVEFSSVSGTTTWYGTSGDYKSGISGRISA